MAKKKKTTKKKAGRGKAKALRSIEDLKPAPYNPRKISKKAATGLGASIKKFGDLSSIVWNKRTGHLVAGHRRLEQLQKAGAKLVAGAVVARGKTFPVRIVDWDAKTEKAANVAANNPHIAGDFDDGLGDILGELLDDMGAAAFAELNFDTLQDGLGNMTATTQDEVPELPKKAKTKLGDVWTLGRHRLVCGDSADATAVAKCCQSANAYLMATDPPYGVDFKGQKYNPRAKAWAGIEGDKRDGAILTAWLGDVIRAWLPQTHDRAAFYFWCAAMAEGAAAAAAAVREAGLHIQSHIVWVKNSLVLGQADYQWRHENCWYAFKKGKRHRWLGGRAQTTAWEVSKVTHGDYVHPMQKPVELYARSIQNHTRPGDVVLDPFLGSGTQIIAAEQLDRTCRGMELDPRHCDVIVQRWENLTNGKAKRARA